MTDRERFLANLVGLAEMVEKDLTEHICGLYERHLKPYGYHQAALALEAMALKRSKREGFPTLSEIIAEIKPELSADDNAAEVGALIWSCISKFGRYSPEEARLYMGELAWEVASRMGSWEDICNAKESERGIFVAQARELAKTVSKRAKLGLLDERPSLPQPKNQNYLLGSMRPEEIEAAKNRDKIRVQAEKLMAEETTETGRH